MILLLTLSNLLSFDFSVFIFSRQNKKLADQLINATKELFDGGNGLLKGTAVAVDVLPELIVKGFDEEQIWQQIELDNNESIEKLLGNSAKLLSSKGFCSFRSKSAVQKSNSGLSTREKKDQVIRKARKKRIETIANEETSGNQLSDDFQSESENNLGDDSSEVEDERESNLSEEDAVDKNDKFFDFTGDSDDDLNFDFGPLGQKGELDEQLFDKEDSEESGTDGTSSKTKKGKNNQAQKKKNVTFKEDTGNEGQPKRKEAKSKVLKNLVKKRSSVVDDKFFKLADLESFLDQEDKKEERKQKRLESAEKGRQFDKDENESEDDEEHIDMFGEVDSEDEVRCSL